MQTEWMEIAEFAAYIVAVLVGVDMIAERWIPCYKSKRPVAQRPASPLSVVVDDGSTASLESVENGFGSFGEN